MESRSDRQSVIMAKFAACLSDGIFPRGVYLRSLDPETMKLSKNLLLALDAMCNAAVDGGMLQGFNKFLDETVQHVYKNPHVMENLDSFKEELRNEEFAGFGAFGHLMHMIAARAPSPPG